jgi:hypothetical protein
MIIKTRFDLAHWTDPNTTARIEPGFGGSTI